MNYYSFMLILVALLGQSIPVRQENYLVKIIILLRTYIFFRTFVPKLPNFVPKAR